MVTTDAAHDSATETSNSHHADIAAMGYEQARDELTQVVRKLEAGGTSLENSIALWERGEELAAHCHRWLTDARTRLDAAIAARSNATAPGTDAS